MLSFVFWGAVLFLAGPVLGAPAPAADGDVYQIGVGIADVTGPAAQVNLMGYAMIDQTANGIHLRQFSRAFIVDDNTTRVAFVSVDAGMISQAVKIGVTEKLKELYGGLYTEQNVCVSGTHTHSGAAGFFQFFLYEFTSLGFINQTFTALVDGIVASITMAHNNIQPGRLLYSQGDLTDASINRSPPSYANNPAEERAKYEHNTDKKMFLLKLVDINDNPIGMFNWFSVHGTCMNNTNGLLSSDNKGYASILFEQQYNPPGTFPGKGPFVGSFAQSNEGDATPNTRGPMCLDTGLPCDDLTSTCDGRSAQCISLGPGDNMYESTKIIANKQFDKANELFGATQDYLHGPVTFRHQHINMTYRTFSLNGKDVTTCGAALGFSFAAGTIDGPGLYDFHQATKQGEQNDFWDIVRDVLKVPSQRLLDCQVPKAVLLPAGEMDFPYAWTPDIIPIQILKIGNLLLLAVPGEFTTMSGRRTREAVQQIFQDNGADPDGDLQVVIAGLSNIYTNYITTYEEYQIQRYEGGSTMFGPHTLDAYIDVFKTLTTSIIEGTTVEPGPDPENILDQQIDLLPDVTFETAPPGKVFGSVVTDVDAQYAVGSIVSVSFVCGNLRNNLMTDDTFLTVEYSDPNSGEWVVVAVDSVWETRFHWKLTDSFFKQSECTVEWEIPETASIGNYRIRHIGYRKDFLAGTTRYEGISSTFKVNVAKPRNKYTSYSHWLHQ